ncbi:MAG: 2-dehydropantoate 2-reductase [Verrucomicrobiales bacterium]|nr:2-dehydropantoate 2-reductase [Verrucomicrobiales bacterium]
MGREESGQRFRRIAVVGAGAVGCYYGAHIARNHSVTFLMRRDLEAVRRNGLRIFSPDGEIYLEEVEVSGSTEKIGPVDLVIIAVKTTANAELPDLIRPLVQDDTVLLTLQNGLGNEEFLQEYFPDQAVLGGLCFVCINRGAPGEIHHLAHGLVEMGEFTNTGVLDDVVSLFANSGLPVSSLPDMGLARWRKLIWNVPFNGLSIAGGGIDTRQILSDPKLVARTRRLMSEVILTASRLGYFIDPAFAEKNIENTLQMGPYKPSSLIDFLNGQAVEVEAIWGEPLRRAGSVGAETPDLELLYHEICEAVENRSC